MDDKLFKTTCEFLYQYSWIADIQVTKFFTEKAWRNIPETWCEPLLTSSTEELNNIPYGHVKEQWPESLKDFVQCCQLLSPIRSVSTYSSHQIHPSLTRGMSPKKLHEVQQLSAAIDTLCKQSRCKHVVDVGSGMGYLSLVLSEQLQYRVLGLESESSRAHSSQARAFKLGEANCTNFIAKTCNLNDTEEKMSEFATLLNQWTMSTLLPEEVTAGGKKNGSNVEQNMLCESIKEEKCTLSPSKSSCVCDSTSVCDCQKSNKITNSRHVRVPDGINTTTNSHECGADSGCGIMEGISVAKKMECQKSNKFSDNSRCRNVSGLQATEESDSTVCMVGLHACGDLTPTMMRLFSKLPQIKCLLCLSCCYHRMKQTDKMFHNFPMSFMLEKTLHELEIEGSTFNPTLFAFRLAAQETRVRWREQSTVDHEYHMKHVAYRALLDMALQNVGEVFEKDKRKLAFKESFNDFESYCDTVTNRIHLKGDPAMLKSEMLSMYDTYYPYFKFIEPFTCLQVCLQSVVEGLLLWDRVTFLQESGSSATLTPVFSDELSPRNLAIIASK